MIVLGENGAKTWYSVVTTGTAAALSMGFKHGGLRHSLAEINAAKLVSAALCVEMSDVPGPRHH